MAEKMAANIFMVAGVYHVADLQQAKGQRHGFSLPNHPGLPVDAQALESQTQATGAEVEQRKIVVSCPECEKPPARCSVLSLNSFHISHLSR
jgi:hypothetical protein